MARYLYSELANTIQARLNCQASNNDEWFTRHSEKIESLVKEHMPSGSGFDNGTTLDLESSHADKLVFNTAFHHMDESGSYSGWTEHTVTVTPSLSSRFHLRISGRNRNDIKEYIAEQFHCALSYDLQPDMEYEAVSEKTGRKLAYRWIDGCTQKWDVVIPKREHAWTPAVGDTVKLRTFNDYTSRGIHVWAWLKVVTVENGIVSFQVLNGNQPTNEYSSAPLAEVQIPLNWTPSYDADEIVVSDLPSWVEAKAAAVRKLS